VSDITIEAGQQKSEFAVFVDDVQVFSRLELYRYPEVDELIDICSKISP